MSLNRHATCPWPRDLLHYLRTPFRMVLQCTLGASKLRSAFRGLDQGCQFRPGKRSISQIDYGTRQNQPLSLVRPSNMPSWNSKYQFAVEAKVFRNCPKFCMVVITRFVNSQGLCEALTGSNYV